MALFGKSDEKQPTPAGPVASAPPPPPAGAPSAAAETRIGRDTRIQGELVSSDTVRIDGRVEGKIRSTKHLVIGESGEVRAQIEAEWVSIRGTLDGDCSASDKVEITGTGKVFGNINAPVIAVAEGAIFKGSSSMTAEQRKARRAEPRKSDPERAPSLGDAPNPG